MANTKSAKKRARTNLIRRMRNNARKNEIKTLTKRLGFLLGERRFSEALELARRIESKIGKARQKGTLKKNAAARKVSRMMKKLVAAIGKEELVRMTSSARD